MRPGPSDRFQCKESDPEWGLLRGLFPEFLDPRVRAELEYLDQLPEWAVLVR
jgi:hypothetical protein